MPGTFNVYKKVNDWLAFSLSERAPNGSVNDPDIPGGYLAYGRGAYALFMFDIHLTPFAFDLLGNQSDLTLSLSVGHSMFREYLLFDMNDNEVSLEPFLDITNGPYLKFMASVRVWN